MEYLNHYKGTGGGAGIKGAADRDSEGNGSMLRTEEKGVLISWQKVSLICVLRLCGKWNLQMVKLDI